MIKVFSRCVVLLLLTITIKGFGQHKIYEKGLEAYDNGFYNEVIDLFSPETVSTNHVEMKWMLAYSYSRQQYPVQAELYYNKSRNEIWPFPYKYMLDYGNVLRRLERYKEAEIVFRSMGKEPEDLIYSCIWSRQKRINNHYISVTQVPIEEANRINGISKKGNRLLLSIQEDGMNYVLSWLDLKNGERQLFDKSFDWPFNLNSTQLLGDSILIYSGNVSKAQFLNSKALRSGKISRKGENMLFIYSMQLNQKRLVAAPFEFNSPEYGCTHPFMSEDGQRLYFVSNMPGGYGGFDLYYVERRATGWSDPINMGKEINTIYDEGYPYEKEGILFFSSKGHIGYGGYDIFMVSLKHDTTEVENLGKPINSSRDDFSYIEDSISSGYFLSNRFMETGKDQLWHFHRQINYANSMTLSKDKELLSLPDSIYQEVLLFSKEQKRLGKSIEGIVVKGDHQRISSYVVPLPDPLRDKLNHVNHINRKNHLSFDQPSSNDISIVYKEDGIYIQEITSEVIMEFPVQINQNDSIRSVPLYWVHRNKEDLEIDYLFFDFDSYQLNYNILRELDAIASFMIKHPSYNIELAGYADNIGDSNYNKYLSIKRASEVASQLKLLGVSSSRIKVKGKGNELKIHNHIDKQKENPIKRVVRFKFDE